MTMRGAERPGKIKWSRPFLKPLQPLPTFAAWQTFVDIADDMHKVEDITQLLALTDNLPLAVTLIANVAAYEGCPATLARWKRENTLLLSDGYDKRSSLDISITLSFSGSRMTSDAQDLLRILSLLPDGLSNADLVQSDLPIPNILACKATLLKTSLAYIDSDERLKALVPIREYVRNTHPPSASLKNALWRHFLKVMNLWRHFEMLPSSDIVFQIALNFGNINTLLADGLDLEGQDLMSNVESILALNTYSIFTNHGPSPLMSALPEKLACLEDKEIYGRYLVMLFSSAGEAVIQDEQKHIQIGNLHFEYVGDMEKASWQNALGNYYFNQKQDIAKTLQCYHLALSLANGSDAPNRESRWALHGIANAKTVMGSFKEGQIYAQQAAQQAEILSNLYHQSRAIQIEAQCCAHLGDFQHASELCAKARDLLLVCGLQGGSADTSTQNYEAEIHLLKTEYAEAREIHQPIAATFQRRELPTYSSTFSLLNLAVIGVATGVEDEQLQHNIDTARGLFSTTLPFTRGLVFCDLAEADLNLRQGHLSLARTTFEQNLRAGIHNFEEAATFCLERLANIGYGMNDLQPTLNWAALFLGLTLKTKNKLGIHNALKCLGDIYIVLGDDVTALSLFNVALSGFQFMDVQRRKGDCLARIADIYERKGDVQESIAWWTAARPLFEKALQRKEVERIDSKLASL
ncbi:hypothetical protein C8R44DRAFT_803204 [Mycena epipterygia]|nr:hypothetical protein C8R44DRAFT_803204 [Mycena epipterygia]